VGLHDTSLISKTQESRCQGGDTGTPPHSASHAGTLHEPGATRDCHHHAVRDTRGQDGQMVLDGQSGHITKVWMPVPAVARPHTVAQWSEGQEEPAVVADSTSGPQEVTSAIASCSRSPTTALQPWPKISPFPSFRASSPSSCHHRTQSTKGHMAALVNGNGNKRQQGLK
jgi:hypothetical protein